MPGTSLQDRAAKVRREILLQLYARRTTPAPAATVHQLAHECRLSGSDIQRDELGAECEFLRTLAIPLVSRERDPITDVWAYSLTAAGVTAYQESLS